MVLRNPIALVTIPLALALSVIWFRRKKIHSDSGGSKSASAAKQLDNTANNNDSLTHDTQSDQKQSISVPIEQSPCKPQQKTPPSNRFGKSAPIDITPHKTSPKRASSDNPPVEAKVEEKVLNSIEESSSCESVDLPGSSNCRRRFSFTIRTNEPKVVVKATHMDARDLNKSPQSSFEQLTSPTNSSSPSSSFVKPSKMAERKAKADKQQVNGVENGGDGVVTATGTTHVLPLASPPLSLCSNKSDRSQESGDSGKGDSISSPSNSDNGAALLEATVQAYDFQLAQSMVKFLVGKGGVTVRRIREQAKVDVLIRRHPIDPAKYKWCTIQGTQKQIDDALAMIKSKLPAKANIDRIDMELEVKLLQANNVPNANILEVRMHHFVVDFFVFLGVVNAY